MVESQKKGGRGTITNQGKSLEQRSSHYTEVAAKQESQSCGKRAATRGGYAELHGQSREELQGTHRYQRSEDVRMDLRVHRERFRLRRP